MTYSYYDFFAGGGMAGYGLGSEWNCLFANDIDEKKAESYRANHSGGRELIVDDVASISTNMVPEVADLAWASFPCQDLSLAGNGAGLKGFRSGAFLPFWQLLSRLNSEGRAPKIVALENVYGTLRSNKGRDFQAIAQSFAELGYSFGAVVVDAVHFLPQSRPRFVMIGVRSDLLIPASIVSSEPLAAWHPKALIEGKNALEGIASEKWVWWNLPPPPTRTIDLTDIVEDEPTGVKWHSAQETKYLLKLMDANNRLKVAERQRSLGIHVGTVYKRTRPNKEGTKSQRAEVRFDGIAGCLRTPGGGSSRQTIVIINGGEVRSRLLSPREAARLMGLPDRYKLPPRYNQAYQLAGDGVAVPVVEFLKKTVFERVITKNRVSLAA